MAGPIELRFRFCPKHHPGNPFRKLPYLSVDLKGVSSQRDFTTRLNEVFKNEYTDNGKLFRFQLRPGEDTVSFHVVTKADHPCSQDLSLNALRTEYAFKGYGKNRSKGEVVFLHIHFKDKANELPKSPKSPIGYKPLWQSKTRKNQGRAITPKTTPEKRKAIALAKKFSILSLPKHIIRFRLCQYDEFVGYEPLQIDITECESWHDIKTEFWNQVDEDIIDFLESRHNSTGLHFHKRLRDEPIRDRRLCRGDPVMLDLDEELDAETFKVLYCWVGDDDWHRFDRDINKERLLSVHFDARSASPKVKQEPRRSSAARSHRGGSVPPGTPRHMISPRQRPGSRPHTPSNPASPVESSPGGSQRRGNAGPRRGTPSSHFPGDPTSPVNSFAGGSQRGGSVTRSPNARPGSRQGTRSPHTPYGLPAARSRGTPSSRQGTGPVRGQSPTSPQYPISSSGQRPGSASRSPNTGSGSRRGAESRHTLYGQSPPKPSSSRSQRNGSVPRGGSSRGATPTVNGGDDQLLEQDDQPDVEPADEEFNEDDGDGQLLQPDDHSDVEPTEQGPNDDAVEEPEPSPTLDTERPEDENTLEELHKESRKRKASDAGLAQPSKAVKFLDVDDGRRYVRIGKVNVAEDVVEAQDDEEDSNPKLEVILVAVIQPKGARGSSESSVQYLTVNSWLINGSRIGAYHSASQINPVHIEFRVDPFWAPKWRPSKPEELTNAILDWAFRNDQWKTETGANAPKAAPLRLEHSLEPFIDPNLEDDDEEEEIDVVITFVNNLAKVPLGLPEYMHAALDNDETCGTFKSYLLDNVVSGTYGTLDHMLNDDDSDFNFWGDIKIWVLPHSMEKTMYEWQNDGTFAEEFLDINTVEAFGKRQLYIEVHVVEAEDAEEKDREWKERMKGKRARTAVTQTPRRRSVLPQRRVREVSVETRDDDAEDETFDSLEDLEDD